MIGRPTLWAVLAIILCFRSLCAEEIPVTIPEQPRADYIHFSHRAHLNDYGVVCADCHVTAATSELATDNLLARKKNCEPCHAQEVVSQDQCGKCHKPNTEYVAFSSPERVIDFHHQYHTEILKLDCESCHVGMDRTDYASRASWPVMDDCLTCHQDRDAPFDCETCHPKVEVIRPQTHQQDWMYEHKQHVRAVDMPCSKCHEDTWCEDCHSGALLGIARAPSEQVLVAAPSSRGRVVQTVQRQHDLSYRFTHPIDAVGKTQQCQTCHEPDFCVDCHRTEGQEERFRPVWHGPVPGEVLPWILSAVGSGGGRHGEWARRDIERCIACHDVEGDDPSCVQCHVDLDGVRGTDPQTHPPRYADFVGEGDFHDNPGSLCYTCHTSTTTSGAGFCGYCHE